MRHHTIAYTPEHWSEAKLAAWLCRNVRETYITQSSMMVFVSTFLSELLKAEGLDLARANRHKFLVVEYKGADRWADVEPDRRIGELWEELSGGKCRFVMVKDKRWDWIVEKLRRV